MVGCSCDAVQGFGARGIALLKTGEDNRKTIENGKTVRSFKM